MSAKGSSLWRVAGMSYLQYVNKSAGHLRAAVKEPKKAKIATRDSVNFAGFKWANAERGVRADVNSLEKAAEVFKTSA